jgi:LacI family transcriptional regulator
MRTVARLAGVSSATISRVINGSSTVRKETAERVREVIEQLKFIPNSSATTLKYNRSNTYGLIIPDLNNPFYPEFMLNFEEALVKNDQEILVATTQSHDEKLNHSVRRMLVRRVDGVVLMASEADTCSIEPILEHRIPIVTIDRRRTENGCADVAIAFEPGLRAAVLHLRQMGHRRIAFIGGTEGLRTSAIRLHAFEEALQHVGLSFDPKLVRAGNYRVDGGDVAVRSLLGLARRPTAIMTVNDLTAFGALRALHAFGIAVPEEMSVVGFDGILLSDAVHPPLTTVVVPLREMAKRCLQALEQVKKDVSRKGPMLSVEGTLLIRNSTGPAPREQA